MYGFVVVRSDDIEEVLEPSIVQFCRNQFAASESVATRQDLVEFNQKDTTSIAYSSQEMAPHTDGTFLGNPPRIMALKCLTPDTGTGGTSILVDGYRLADRLADDDRRLLSSARFFFRAPTDSDQGMTAPVFAVTSDGRAVIRYRIDRKYQPKSDSSDANRALRGFQQLVELREDWRYVELQSGDVLITDNYRILHGRTRLSGLTERRLLRMTFTTGQ